jgi:nitrite reductase/ring-hydroxylating ferredoxin subunit
MCRIADLVSVILFLSLLLITEKPMKRFLRIAFFFAAALSPVITNSCGKDGNDVIPDVYVDFTIDLLDPEFVHLSVIDVSDTIDATTNNWGNRSAGYDGNGIIIYSGPDEYYAYDRTCPHDFSVFSLSIKVRADGVFAECPECGTKYSLTVYGTPISGPGKYPLKNYKTSFDGERYIRVWND